MQDFSFEAVARKSVKGIFALVSRTFFIQAFNTLTFFILAAYLLPSTYGVFVVVTSIIVFLNYFQDIGLAASLIQKKEEPTQKEFQLAFTTQQLLVLSIIIPMLFLSQTITSFYHLNQQAFFLLIALIISFFLSSLRTIPTVIMERRLDFNKLVMPQIGETIVYNIALIICAVNGYEITSFTIAILLRSFVGLIITYYVQPWKIGLNFHFRELKSLIKFGIPFQLNSILAFIKDDFLLIYLGKILPFGEVGYIGFSQKTAYMPLRLVMDNVIKITFPSYSRLQHDKTALKIAIEKSLFLIALVIFPTIVVVILLLPYFIHFISRYNKWEVAIVSLIFFSLSTILSSLSTPLTNFLNAIGKVKITLYLMAFWTISTWVITILFIKSFGFVGVSIAAFVISLTSIFVIIISKTYVGFSITKPIVRQFLAAIGMFIFVLLTRGIVTNIYFLMLEIFLACIFYIILLYSIAKDDLRKNVRFIISVIKQN